VEEIPVERGRGDGEEGYSMGGWREPGSSAPGRNWDAIVPWPGSGTRKDWR